MLVPSALSQAFIHLNRHSCDYKMMDVQRIVKNPLRMKIAPQNKDHGNIIVTFLNGHLFASATTKEGEEAAKIIKNFILSSFMSI